MYRNNLRLLTLIVAQNDVGKAAQIIEKHYVPVQYLCIGQGTATSEMMDYLGLGISEKRILISVVSDNQAGNIFEELKLELKLNKPNQGVAFTLPISGSSLLVMKLFNEEIQKKILAHIEKENEEMPSAEAYNLLIVTINQGYSEEVMAAAKLGGATGGTVIHARRLGADEPMKRWGISIQPEKELIYILAEHEKKQSIMKMIGEHCGIHSKAQGMVISIPVDAVIGFEGI